MRYTLIATILLLSLAACGQNTVPADRDKAPAANESAAPEATSLEVTVDGLRNSQGQVLCSLFRETEGFPSDSSTAARKARVELPVEGAVEFRFQDVEPGPCAIAVVHDENGNGVLDRGFLGKPTEGYGVSNNPEKGFSAPSFEQARLDLSPGNRQITVTVRYY
jgi:uncharacterized protein (DUF2141 family)